MTKIFVKKFGEQKVLIYGALGETLSYLGFALAPTGAWMMTVLVFSSPFWVAFPTLQSQISRDIPSNEQGELQGSLMSLTSVISIMTPLICTLLYSRLGQPNESFYFPGAPYAFGAFTFFVAFFLLLNFNKKILNRVH